MVFDVRHFKTLATNLGKSDFGFTRQKFGCPQKCTCLTMSKY